MDESFWQANDDLIGGVATIAAAFAIAYAVDRFGISRAGRLADQVTDNGVSSATRTRLRVVRRLVFALIVVIGIGLALSQFTKLEKLAAGLLASSAVLGIVLGLAARQVLANPLAGILLAVTQPIRIGDAITINGESGTVEDITLSYTYIDAGDGRLMIIPNEQVVTTVVFNRSRSGGDVPATASVWLPPGGDVDAARAALEPLRTAGVEVAEITPDGVRLLVRAGHDPEGERAPKDEATLRERAHQLLLEAGAFGPPAE
ncbi:hypothetical protein BH24ACT23_BH24ACT23_00090 [soil metagenome]